MKTTSLSGLAAAVIAASTLTGCYIVPLQPAPAGGTVAVPAAPAAP